MEKNKKKRLEDAGWRVGSTAEFLELSPEEAAFVELKLTLSTELRARRNEAGLSQVELARRLGSSQSRVAKMEASDPSAERGSSDSRVAGGWRVSERDRRSDRKDSSPAVSQRQHPRQHQITGWVHVTRPLAATATGNRRGRLGEAADTPPPSFARLPGRHEPRNVI